LQGENAQTGDQIEGVSNEHASGVVGSSQGAWVTLYRNVSLRQVCLD